VEHDEAPQRVSKGLARHPIPVLLVARLAVARIWQGRGIGGGLIKDAMVRAVAAAEIAGIRAIYVEAKDDVARRFYERFDFIASEEEPNHLFLLMKQARVSVSKRAPAP
jgi:predicted N-acetyltransferase YhbS